jgi:hypothetical protein
MNSTLNSSRNPEFTDYGKMIEVGTLKNFNSTTYKAGVQLAGSLTAYFDDVSVAGNIPASAMVAGNYVIVAVPGGNAKDACVIATWPRGGGSFPDLKDTPSGYSGQAGKYLKVNDAADALEFGYKSRAFVEGWPSGYLLQGSGQGADPDLRRQTDFLCARPTRYLFFECWKDLAGWTESHVGSGGATPSFTLVSLRTGTTVNSRASIYGGLGFNHPHEASSDLIIQFIQSETNLTNSVIRLYLHNYYDSLPPSDTSRHGGFKIINGQIWATNGNGSAQTTTDTGATIAAAWSAQQLRLIGTGSSMQFYVNNILKAEHDTNLPSLWGYRLYLGITNDAAIDQSVRIKPIAAHG